tara:strand:+ start:4566 stop:4856 length:291 start_codon:yes stop_codon:yes gene_type:complete
MEILLRPILTEKATNESELRNTYTFVVSNKANKVEIKRAVESSYGVSVEKVRTMIYGAETKTRYTKRGIQNSKKGSYKKAIVKISEGDRIDFFANL